MTLRLNISLVKERFFMIYYFMLAIFLFSGVVLCKYEGTNKKLVLTLLTFVVISIIGLSINDGEGWKKTLFTYHNETISKEIKVEELSIKNENITIFLDDNYKILISKKANDSKYEYEIYKNSTKLENIRFYGFNEIFSSTDKIKNDSYKPKVTFDFSGDSGEVEEVYFKLTPNDVEKKY